MTASRVLRYLGGGVLLLLLVAALAVWIILRSSLPELEGQAAVTGIAAEATIERDDAGVPHIRAANRLDLAFATGYAHAQDRWFQMDLARRSAAGELAELFGEIALDYDRRRRLHRFRARAEARFAAFDESQRRLIEHYTAGVNAGLASLNARPFEYWLLRAEPALWQPADSLLVALAMFFDLNDERADRDLQRGLAARVLPPEVFAFLYPDGTEWDAPLQGVARERVPVPGPELYDLRDYARPATDEDVHDGRPMPGSNNWAVHGSLSTTGAAIVANDMHLGLRVPNVFYRARLESTGSPAVDVSGVTLAGVPAIVTGSNGRVAWAFTNSYGDWSDAVIVTPGSRPGTYLAPDGERAFEVHDERIAVKGGRTEYLEVRETIWGPVREDVVHPDGEVAIRWIAHHPEALNLESLRIETAQSLAEAMAIANRAGIPPQNFVAGDAAGNIGWTIAGRIPVRGTADSSLPLDGRRQAGYEEWRAPEDYPRIVNPAGGRIWTANARVVDAEDLAIVGDSGYDLGARARQIRDGLRAREQFAPADMLDIHLDDRALFLTRWHALLLSLLDEGALADNPARADFRLHVENWQARASADSVGYRFVRAFRYEVRSLVFNMLLTPVREAYPHRVPLRVSRQFEGPLWTLVTERPAHLLTANYADWRALLLEAVDRNIAHFSAMDGGLDAQIWGRRNTAAIRHPLAGAVPFGARWLDMPRDALSGDDNMPRVQSPSFGASERFAVSPGHEDLSFLHMPTGQSGHPLSPYYRRGHSAWVEGRPTPFLPGPARHRLQLTPAE